MAAHLHRYPSIRHIKRKADADPGEFDQITFAIVVLAPEVALVSCSSIAFYALPISTYSCTDGSA